MQVDVVLSGSLYSADVVMRTAQRFTGECLVDVEQFADGYRLRLVSRDPSTDSGSLEMRFKNDLLDERLREQVRNETKELHVALVQAALKGAVRSGAE